MSLDGKFKYKDLTLCHGGFDLKWVNKYLGRNPEVIIEFGSYDGGDGVRFKQTYPDADVYSLEGCENRFNIIKNYNVEETGVKLFNYAVSDIDGEIDFYPMTDSNDKESNVYGGSGSILKATDKYKKTFNHLKHLEPVKVQSIRIDTFCEMHNITNIDILHIDAEGGDLIALKSIGKLRPKLVFLEKGYGKDWYGPKAYSDNEILDFLSPLGYTIKEDTNIDGLYVLN